MNGWKKGLVLAAAVVAVTAGCGGADRIAAPDAVRYDENAPAPPPGSATTQTDSGGRWGGFLGSGT